MRHMVRTYKHTCWKAPEEPPVYYATWDLIDEHGMYSPTPKLCSECQCEGEMIYSTVLDKPEIMEVPD